MKDHGSLFGTESSTPGEHLRRLLDERGWTQEELATITDRSRQHIIDLIAGRSGVTADMAIALGAAFGTGPDVWMRLDAAWRLRQAEEDPAKVEHRARLFELAPLKDMQKRGWIKTTKSIKEIEAELLRFFEADSLDQPPEFPVALRAGNRLTEHSPQCRAWCFRVRQLAKALHVQPFDERQLPKLKRDLRMLAAYPAEASRVPDLMRKAGIRFVVVEPLTGGKRLGGCAFWLDEQKPVLGMTIGSDRNDNFWFTLMHELAHIEHKDRLSVDLDVSAEDRSKPVARPEEEKKADEAAADSLIPQREMDSFIRRIGPLYAKPNIIQFAHRIKIHPGIIVGQLQHRGEIGFSANREMLPKIRSHVISTALTDGWGNEIAPGSI